MEFIVAGASAVQIGTANFYRPTVSLEILDALPAALTELGVTRISAAVGTLTANPRSEDTNRNLTTRRSRSSNASFFVRSP